MTRLSAALALLRMTCLTVAWSMAGSGCTMQSVSISPVCSLVFGRMTSLHTLYGFRFLPQGDVANAGRRYLSHEGCAECPIRYIALLLL
eukprot:SAG31_NODE_611_length_13558_cov_224.959730_16_plen_89_part_00